MCKKYGSNSEWIQKETSEKKNCTEYWITNKGVSRVELERDRVLSYRRVKQCQWKLSVCHCPFSSELNWFWESIIHEFNTHSMEKTWKMDETRISNEKKTGVMDNFTHEPHFFLPLFFFSFLDYVEFKLWHDFLSEDNNLLWFGNKTA